MASDESITSRPRRTLDRSSWWPHIQRWCALGSFTIDCYNYPSFLYAQALGYLIRVWPILQILFGLFEILLIPVPNSCLLSVANLFWELSPRLRRKATLTALMSMSMSMTLVFYYYSNNYRQSCPAHRSWLIAVAGCVRGTDGNCSCASHPVNIIVASTFLRFQNGAAGDTGDTGDTDDIVPPAAKAALFKAWRAATSNFVTI